MSAEPVIELVRASICRDPGTEPLLRDVSWRVLPGEFWVVTGSHGSGKSLLLETMAGIRPCGGGQVRWFGEPVNVSSAEDGARAALRRRLGLVFEGGGRVFSQLSVAENIALPLSYHTGCPLEESLERTAVIRSALDLDRLAAAPAGRVGRAWMQRIALGRALSLQPEVLLLDNPVAGMDPSHVRWWREFLPLLSQGHPAAGSRPVTLVVTADDSIPWVRIARQFAEVHACEWRVLAKPEIPGQPPTVARARD